MLLMLYSSVCSTIAATELTGAGRDIQSRTFPQLLEVYMAHRQNCHLFRHVDVLLGIFEGDRSPLYCSTWKLK